MKQQTQQINIFILLPMMKTNKKQTKIQTKQTTIQSE